MKRITILAAVAALTLLVSGLGIAASNMDHGSHGVATGHGEHGTTPAVTLESGMKTMTDNLNMMKKDVEMMKDPAMRSHAMDAMNTHMTDMHHGMASAEGHAKQTGDAAMQNAMTQMNKDMMTVMKGMGMSKKDPDKGIPMMEQGLEKLEKTMTMMQGMM
ncbi:MAG: hypothetical protein ABIK45_04720 [Pseudomonadota bacterium]